MTTDNASERIRTLAAGAAAGDEQAVYELVPLVYAQLRKLGGHYLSNERAGQSIQPTELVHEAWLRLAGENAREWQGRTHVLAMAAISMRRILVERARRKQAQKRGQG